ncbi:MAG: terminase family protein [Vicinamibacterales bacterium]
MAPRPAEAHELVLRWGPIPGTPQEAFFDDDTPDANLLFTGGWFAGKTMTLTAKALKLSAINNPVQGFWLVPDWNHIERTILPTIQDVDPDTGDYWFLAPHQFAYNHRTHILTWAGGGPIQFLTAENPRAIAGPSGAWLAVDEPGSIRHAAWRNAVARVRSPRAALRQKVASGTWEGLNWLADMFGDPARPERYKVYTMRTAENTEGLRHNPEYIAEVKDNITEAEAASYLDAKLSNLTGVLAFPAFAETLHWREDVTGPDRALPLRLMFDFNVDPMTLGLGQIVSGPFGPELHVVDWIAQYGGATVESCCLALIDRYPEGWPHVIVYGDATGKARHVKSLKSNYQIIRETLMGWAQRLEEKVPAANPPVRESGNAVNRLLLNAHGQTRLWIRKTQPHRQCPTRELVKSLQRTTKKIGTDEIEKKAGETHTHAGEALRYLVAAEFPIVRPRVTAGAMQIEWL